MYQSNEVEKQTRRFRKEKKLGRGSSRGKESNKARKKKPQVRFELMTLGLQPSHAPLDRHDDFFDFARTLPYLLSQSPPVSSAQTCRFMAKNDPTHGQRLAQPTRADAQRRILVNQGRRQQKRLRGPTLGTLGTRAAHTLQYYRNELSVASCTST